MPSFCHPSASLGLPEKEVDEYIVSNQKCLFFSTCININVALVISHMDVVVIYLFFF